ncbi:hypothetical protein PMEGAPR236_55480 [Priestia megaterium]|jgi:hypothetical protein
MYKKAEDKINFLVFMSLLALIATLLQTTWLRAAMEEIKDEIINRLK